MPVNQSENDPYEEVEQLRDCGKFREAWETFAEIACSETEPGMYAPDAWIDHVIGRSADSLNPKEGTSPLREPGLLFWSAARMMLTQRQPKAVFRHLERHRPALLTCLEQLPRATFDPDTITGMQSFLEGAFDCARVAGLLALSRRQKQDHRSNCCQLFQLATQHFSWWWQGGGVPAISDELFQECEGIELSSFGSEPFLAAVTTILNRFEGTFANELIPYAMVVRAVRWLLSLDRDPTVGDIKSPYLWVVLVNRSAGNVPTCCQLILEKDPDPFATVCYPDPIFAGPTFDPAFRKSFEVAVQNAASLNERTICRSFRWSLRFLSRARSQQLAKEFLGSRSVHFQRLPLVRGNSASAALAALLTLSDLNEPVCSKGCVSAGIAPDGSLEPVEVQAKLVRPLWRFFREGDSFPDRIIMARENYAQVAAEERAEYLQRAADLQGVIDLLRAATREEVRHDRRRTLIKAISIVLAFATVSVLTGYGFSRLMSASEQAAVGHGGRPESGSEIGKNPEPTPETAPAAAPLKRRAEVEFVRLDTTYEAEFNSRIERHLRLLRRVKPFLRLSPEQIKQVCNETGLDTVQLQDCWFYRLTLNSSEWQRPSLELQVPLPFAGASSLFFFFPVFEGVGGGVAESGVSPRRIPVELAHGPTDVIMVLISGDEPPSSITFSAHTLEL
ncbi:MAG: hypothetical protein Fues2KO_04680 [Fuerstiella sp.]